MSDTLEGWAQNRKTPEIHAFQLALWELTHDSDFNITDDSGEIYIGNQTSGRNRYIKERNSSIALAQTMLNDVNTADVNNTYISDTFAIWALADAGNPGQQDVILATLKSSENYTNIKDLLPAPALPEPTTHALMGLFGIVYWAGRRFRS